MNTRTLDRSLLSAFAADPLASRADATALAELAFGSFSRTREPGSVGRHLALLSADSLALDLSDPAQRRFGNYELLELIGEGGMGVVYRARQHGLEREVAVKLLAAGPWASREYVARFQHEAQNAARMQHPNIVPIYEVGTSEELHFFSMRLIRGGSLASLLKQDGPLDARRAAGLLRTVAEAVDYAHRLGVLHLDLKPANVLLDEDGAPHVADFGLARRLDEALAAANHEVSGTPSYMAPEQATAGTHGIAPATDVWGLGAILYELVTGRPPYLGATPQDTLKRVVGEPLTPPRTYAPALPADLDAVIGKCLAHDVAQRYPSARELAEDLTAFLDGRPVRARPLTALQRVARFARREPLITALTAAAFAALAIGIVATDLERRRADGNAARAASNAAQAEANARQADERLWQSRRDAAVRLMSEGNGFAALTPLIANVADQQRAGRDDAASIERREIGMIQAQGVTLIDRMIVPDAAPLAAALSDDGRTLALGLGDFSVRWYDTAALTERGRVDLSRLPTSDGAERAPRALRFLDGHRLAVTLEWFDYLAAPSGHDTYLVDLERARVSDVPQHASANFSADATHALLYWPDGGEQLWHVEPWQALGAIRHPPRPSAWQEFLTRDGRFVLTKTEDHAGFLHLADARTASSPRPLAISAPITAWAENRAGTALALGDSRGRLYVLDPRSGALRQLATPAGREVTWIAFSDDDAWLAAVRWDGAAYAFDLATDAPLNGGEMRNAFEPHHVAIDRAERLLVVSGLGDTAVWRLPQDAPNPMAATPLLASPPHRGRAGTNATATALRARLLATAEIDGEVRLWRLPPPPLTPAQAPRRGEVNVTDGGLVFDGKSLPDIAERALRVASVDGRSATPWRTLPQPIGFAELVAGGTRLVASAGPALYVFAVAPQTLEPTRDALALPANPHRLAVTPDGRYAVTAVGANDGNGFEEQLDSYALDTGTRVGHVTVPGPLRAFALSADGARLLTVGPAASATNVFALPALARAGTYPHDAERPVTAAAFVPDASTLWLLARDADDHVANDADLLLWDPASADVRERRHVGGVFPIGIAAVAGKPMLAARDRDVFDPDGPAETIVTTGPHHEPTAVFATSHDGRLFAHVLGRDVRLYDTRTFAPIGPPLDSGLHNHAFPLQLAFSADDATLLAQPARVAWRVAADTRPLAELRALAERVLPDDTSRHVLTLPSQAERERLRRADPGPPPAPEQRPSLPVARSVRGYAIPARDPAASPLLLDLTAHYNRPGDAVTDMTSSTNPGVTGRRLGIARIDGVDYDLRGGIELRQAGHGDARATGIRVPPVPIAAFHVLLAAPLATPEERERDYALVRLHYRDGSAATLPIRTQRDVPGFSAADAPTPIGWVQGDALRLVGLSRQALTSNPRLVNPHPEKRIETLDLEAVDARFSNPIFFAVTAEPVTAGGGSGMASSTEHAPRQQEHPCAARSPVCSH